MEEHIPEVCVILPAAGLGERMESNIPKQFIPVLGQPLVSYTINSFLQLEYVKRIVVLYSELYLKEMMETKSTFLLSPEKEKVLFTVGGETRHESIFNGLKYLQDYDQGGYNVVVIHDGVRPLVDEYVLREVVRAASKHGAAGVMCPLVSTVIEVDEENHLFQSLDRSKYRASEMPQAFLYSVIVEAYSKCSDEDKMFGTECLQLVQKYMNINAKLVSGTSMCWKVTHKKDIPAAKKMIKESQSVCIVGDTENLSLVQSLKQSLVSKFKEVDGLCSSPNYRAQNFILIYDKVPLAQAIDTEIIQLDMVQKPSTIIHIILDVSLTEIPSIQKKAKEIAKTCGSKNIISYYVVVEANLKQELLKEMSEMVTSLLCDSNVNLSGQIFVSCN